METVNRLHLVAPVTVWQTVTEYFITRSIPFAITFGKDPLDNEVLIYTVQADGVVTTEQLTNIILEVQGYLTAFDITPIIHLQS